ncbi:MAG TPA: hypothetical protein VFX37_15230 [Pseudolabrys sp.]|nr:hypothetical protein [Pseudolabrys sp.]
MAKLTAAKRKALPKSDFAGPGKSFPIPDKSHAKAALRDIPLAKNLSLEEAQKIRAAAYRKLGKSNRQK